MKLGGSIRTFSNEIREALPGQMEQIIKGITDAYHAGYEFCFEKGFSSVINNELLTQNVEALLSGHFGEDSIIHIDPRMPSEDFSVYAGLRPGCFIELGAMNPEKHCNMPHHNCGYRLDEDALAYGAEYFFQLIKDRLK